MPPNGSEIELHDAEADRQQHDHEHQDQQDPAQAREDPGRAGRDQQAHRAQREQLAPGRRCLAEALDRALEVARPPFGERQRRVGHAPQLHPLLRARGGDRSLEVAARLLGVEALGRARAEDRQGRRLVFRLGFELLVGALLEGLDRLQATALLHADLALFGCHRRLILRFANPPRPRRRLRRRDAAAIVCRATRGRVCSADARRPPHFPARACSKAVRLRAARADADGGHLARRARRGRKRRRRSVQRTEPGRAGRSDENAENRNDGFDGTDVQLQKNGRSSPSSRPSQC